MFFEMLSYFYIILGILLLIIPSVYFYRKNRKVKNTTSTEKNVNKINLRKSIKENYDFCDQIINNNKSETNKKICYSSNNEEIKMLQNKLDLSKDDKMKNELHLKEMKETIEIKESENKHLKKELENIHLDLIKEKLKLKQFELDSEERIHICDKYNLEIEILKEDLKKYKILEENLNEKLSEEIEFKKDMKNEQNRLTSLLFEKIDDIKKNNEENSLLKETITSLEKKLAELQKSISLKKEKLVNQLTNENTQLKLIIDKLEKNIECKIEEIGVVKENEKSLVENVFVLKNSVQELNNTIIVKEKQLEFQLNDNIRREKVMTDLEKRIEDKVKEVNYLKNINAPLLETVSFSHEVKEMKKSIEKKEEEFVNKYNKLEECICNLQRVIDDKNGEIEDLRMKEMFAKDRESYLKNELEGVKMISHCENKQANGTLENLFEDRVSEVVNSSFLDENHQLRAQVEQYRNSLERTEQMLEKIQFSVDKEETKWKFALESSERYCSKLELTVKELLLEMKDLKTTNSSETQDAIDNVTTLGNDFVYSETKKKPKRKNKKKKNKNHTTESGNI